MRASVGVDGCFWVGVLRSYLVRFRDWRFGNRLFTDGRAEGFVRPKPPLVTIETERITAVIH